jgi:hypothetical protein
MSARPAMPHTERPSLGQASPLTRAIVGNEAAVAGWWRTPGTHIARLTGNCHPGGGSRARLRSGKARDSVRLRAHGGCVWSVTVKDPRRFLGKRYLVANASPSKGRHKAESAQPIRTFHLAIYRRREWDSRTVTPSRARVWARGKKDRTPGYRYLMTRSQRESHSSSTS